MWVWCFTTQFSVGPHHEVPEMNLVRAGIRKGRPLSSFRLLASAEREQRCSRTRKEYLITSQSSGSEVPHRCFLQRTVYLVILHVYTYVYLRRPWEWYACFSRYIIFTRFSHVCLTRTSWMSGAKVTEILPWRPSSVTWRLEKSLIFVDFSRHFTAALLQGAGCNHVDFKYMLK